MISIVSTTFYITLFLGTLLLLIAAGSQIYRRESPVSFLFVGISLLVLPLATKIKVGPDGAEFDINAKIAEVQAKVEAIAENKGSANNKNPIANKYLALVLYNEESIVDKNEIVKTLRQHGYLASTVATDFSNLGDERQLYQPGQAYIKYGKGLEVEAQKIKLLIQKIDGMKEIRTREVPAFKTGDIQIGLF